MPIKDAYPRDDIADLASGYNMPGVVVDGQDVIAVHEAMEAAVARARAGDGPSLLECKTFRYRSHSEGGEDTVHHDVRPQEEVEAWKKRDPIKMFREKLLAQNVATEAELDAVDASCVAEAEEVERFASESPVPGPEILGPALYAD
jgi:pyruvate dehydrogenase E1 component alpha subunit